MIVVFLDLDYNIHDNVHGSILYNLRTCLFIVIILAVTNLGPDVYFLLNGFRLPNMWGDIRISSRSSSVVEEPKFTFDGFNRSLLFWI